MTRVSIFMSSYNHADYLQRAIESVLDQSFTDFELYIVDDVSTDGSWPIIQAFTDPRLTASRNPSNRNDKTEQNRFIRDLARGEFIAIHHSDGVWEPDKLRQQVAFLDAQPAVGAVFTNARIIDERGRLLTDKSHPYYSVFDQPNRSRHEWLRFFWDGVNALCHPSVLIRKKCYEDCGYYRHGFGQIPDLDMWTRLCLKHDLHVLPEKFTHFRIRTDEQHSSGNRPETRIRAQFEFLQVLQNYLQITSFDELIHIFPEAREHVRPEGADLGYALARIALQWPGRNPVHRLFGLQVLFDALNDPSRRARLADLYGFGHRDFIRLTAANDVFATIRRETTRRLALVLDRLGAVLAPRNSIAFRRLRVLYRTHVFPGRPPRSKPKATDDA